MCYSYYMYVKILCCFWKFSPCAPYICAWNSSSTWLLRIMLLTMLPGWLFNVFFVIDLTSWNSLSLLSANAVILEMVLLIYKPACGTSMQLWTKIFLNDNTSKFFLMTVLQSKNLRNSWLLSWNICFDFSYFLLPKEALVCWLENLIKVVQNCKFYLCSI